LAGATVALEILDHLASESPDLAPSLKTLRTDILEDREQLKALMARLNIQESRARKAGGWIAERVAEVKLEVDDDQKGPLRRLERLEALSIGIEGKVALWRALNAVPANDALVHVDCEKLSRRGEEQRAQVEAWRLQAARDALVI